ncbi:type I-E CRISPR-associated protein Cas6/Cse3/CasE [bacterium]|jgi:CRISPR system Cascade subunit CasE|nr:type I-E CRISPR-associated protein Cas6/Cse3/CasE [bacterium]
MIFSQLLLNPGSHQVQKELANPYELHRTLLNGFAGNTQSIGRVLYRLEIRDREPYLEVLVQSVVRPDWSALANKGYLLCPAQVKEVSPVFSAGQQFQFKLHANPTKKQKQPDASGKRIFLTGEKQQLAWLERKSIQHGFQIMAVQAQTVPSRRLQKRTEKDTFLIQLGGVNYEGVLTVQNASLFTSAWSNGIGSAKGFGFGMLSLKR